MHGFVGQLLFYCVSTGPEGGICMTTQYGKGDYVRYASSGVCLIEDIRQETRPGSREQKEFYILKPVANHGGTIFIPADSPVLFEKMQAVPSAEEVSQILLSVKEQETEWVDDRKVRSANFQAVLKQCELKELIEMVRCLYQRRKDIAARGKKLSSSDETLLRRAESILENELSFVLQIPEKQVGAYLREALEIVE